MIGKILINFFVLVCLTVLQMRWLHRRGLKKEAIVNGGLMLLALIISILMIAKVIPSFITPLKIIFQPIGEKLLK